MSTRLIVADSEHDANMLYVTRMFVPDPFIWFESRGKSLRGDERSGDRPRPTRGAC